MDQLLVERKLVPSRQAAQAAILEGRVRVDGRVARKAGERVRADAGLELLEGEPWVSRGGRKLAGALERFRLDVRGTVCADVGASTGGFTDVLLHGGAARVYAVDVGRGQLAWRLRSDPRVVVLEGVNARYLGRREIPEPLDLAVVDVSFISLAKVLPALVPLLRPGGRLLALVKPQFEAGPRQVGKGGVVRDPGVHRRVLAAVDEAAAALGLGAEGLTWSPVTGASGNIEFFVLWRQGGEGRLDPARVEALVAEAHRRLRPRREEGATDGGGASSRHLDPGPGAGGGG
ncbi:MAG: TlyA family RNA methyltransferase [Clostridia bacterium]|nr:TlyA family RNA methyltransferase [Clostridia bacterium]